MPTFWYRKKPEQHDAVTMCAADIVVDVTDRHIDGPIFILTGSDRHGSFITTQNNWDEHSTMRLRIFGNNILM